MALISNLYLYRVCQFLIKWVLDLKTFELTIPKQYLDHINKEIKKPKRPNTELLELWLERELSIENEGTYGNLPTDESHVTVEVLAERKLQSNNFRRMLWHDCVACATGTTWPQDAQRRRIPLLARPKNKQSPRRRTHQSQRNNLKL